MDKNFDFEKALKAVRNGQSLLGKQGVLTPLIKRINGSST